jgi:hypothetical protein
MRLVDRTIPGVNGASRQSSPAGPIKFKKQRSGVESQREVLALPPVLQKPTSQLVDLEYVLLAQAKARATSYVDVSDPLHGSP